MIRGWVDDLGGNKGAGVAKGRLGRGNFVLIGKALGGMGDTPEAPNRLPRGPNSSPKGSKRAPRGSLGAPQDAKQ